MDKEKIDEYLVQELDKIQAMGEGGDKDHAVSNLAKFWELSIKEQELLIKETELENKKETDAAADDLKGQELDLREKLEMRELDLKETEVSFNWKKVALETSITVGLALVEKAFFGRIFRRSLEFETTGTYCAQTSKHILGNLMRK